jgi:hypothetical protein
VADFQEKRGEEEAAQEFARRAFEHSKEAATLSIEAFAQMNAAEAEPISGKTLARIPETGPRATTTASGQTANLGRAH